MTAAPKRSTPYDCDCPNGSYGKKHSHECFLAQIEILKIKVDELEDDNKKLRELKANTRKCGHTDIELQIDESHNGCILCGYEQLRAALEEIADNALKLIGQRPTPVATSSPEFTHPDLDLNLLLNLTATMGSGKPLNMDFGIAWQEALEAVEARLTLVKNETHETVDLNLEPVGKCDVCGRKIWKFETVGRLDLMTQPDGSQCGGRFIAL